MKYKQTNSKWEIGKFYRIQSLDHEDEIYGKITYLDIANDLAEFEVQIWKTEFKFYVVRLDRIKKIENPENY